MADQAGDAQGLLLWLDPFSGSARRHPLRNGESVTIGRSSSNDIQIAEGHVSRTHAVISCRDGAFTLDDLDSANGTFLNGQRISGSSPLAIGDEIHLFVTMLMLTSDSSENSAELEARLADLVGDRATLRITSGAQKRHVFALLKDEIYIGRSTPKASWEIALHDATVSRPHALLLREQLSWKLFDLGSVNGTSVNKLPVTGGKAQALRDGDQIVFGATTTLFRLGYNSAAAETEKDQGGAP